MNFINSWYLVYTKFHYEKWIVQKLDEQNFKVHLPLIIVVFHWNDYKKRIEKSLLSALEVIKDCLNQFFQIELKILLDLKVVKKKISLGSFKGCECEIIKTNNKQKVFMRIASL